MTLKAKMKSCLSNVVAAIGVIVLSSSIAWAQECNFYKEGPSGNTYVSFYVFMYRDANCGSGTFDVCCTAVCFQSSCPDFNLITCSTTLQCHPIVQTICDGTSICA